jgi:tetratricopeptide (TPR) repeat protein
MISLRLYDIVVVAATVTALTSSEEHLESARHLLDERQYGRALAEVDAAEADGGEGAALLVIRGRGLNGLGDVTGALASFDEALRLDPQNIEAASGAAAALLQLAAFGQRPYIDAEIAYERAAELPDAPPAVFVGLGRALLGEGKLEQARWRFDDAIARGAGADAYHLAGRILLDEGRYANACERLQEAVARDPQLAEAWADLGRATASVGDSDAAVDRLLYALSLDPDVAATNAYLGTLFVGWGRWEDAVDPLRRAAELEKQHGSAGSYLALVAESDLTRALVGLRRYDEAVAAADEVIGPLAAAVQAFPPQGEANSDSTAVIRNWLAAMYALRGVANAGRDRYDEAVDDQHAAANASPETAGRAWWLAGITRYAQGDYPEAWSEIAKSQDAWESVPTEKLSLDDLRSFASALQSLGLYGKAASLYLAAAEKAPDDSGVWGDLVGLYLERDEHRDLGANLDVAAEGKPSDSNWYAKARDAAARAESLLEAQLAEKPTSDAALALGHLNVLLEEYRHARSYIQEALRLDPDSAFAHANLAMTYAGENKHGKAATSLAAALRREPSDLAIRVKLAEVNLRLGALDQAETHYRRVLRAAPENVEAHAGLGEVLTRQADQLKEPEFYDAAIAHFAKAESLALAMESEVSARRGSSRLSATQLGSVLYGRGYARVKLYESGIREGFRSQRSLLADAARDFSDAVEIDRDNFKAQRACEKVERWTKAGPGGRSLEELAPFIVVGLAFGALVAVQIVFFAGWPVRPAASEWLVGTIGLILFVVAGLSLPQLLKLKVGGIELERSAVEQGVPTSLGISSASVLMARGAFQPSYPAPASSAAPPADASEPLRAAQSGSEATQKANGPRAESQRAAEEGVDRSKRRRDVVPPGDSRPTS